MPSGRPRVRFAILLLVLCGLAPSTAPARLAADEPVTHLASDERIVFFPTAGWYDEARREWVLPIHGWVFEPETDGITRQATLRSLRPLVTDPEFVPIFERRAGAFLVDNESDKEIVVAIGEHVARLPKSAANGHVYGEVRLADPPSEPDGGLRVVRYAARLRSTDRRAFRGQVLLVDPRGRSLVSDIDDTVKITEVGDKRRVIENSLVRPYRVAPGLAELYRGARERGVPLHWVSSSPWQLYEPLAEFFAAERFPTGAWRLKDFRLKDSSFANLLADPEDSKVAAIGQIVERYPERRFTLVGDSGERDPEAYGRLARKFPRQIDQILIRDVTGEDASAGRYQAAWRDLPEGTAQVFRDPTTLKLRD